MLDFIEVKYENYDALKKFVTTMVECESNTRTRFICIRFRTRANEYFRMCFGFIGKFGEYDFRPVTIEEIREAFKTKGLKEVEAVQLLSKNFDKIKAFLDKHCKSNYDILFRSADCRIEIVTARGRYFGPHWLVADREGGYIGISKDLFDSQYIAKL